MDATKPSEYDALDYNEQANVVHFERSITSLTLHDIYDTYEDVMERYGLLQVKGIVQRMMSSALWRTY